MKIKNKKSLFAFLFTISFLLLPFSKAFAEKIQSFKSDIEINKDGTITIEETIDYDFGNLQRHGLLRQIDYKKTNLDGKKFVMDFNILSITDETGRSYNYSKSKIGNYIELKIGDADKLITGQKTYIIKYEVSGAITYFTDHDELYWNLTGNYSEVPIESFSSTITLPQEIRDADIKYVCYEGPDGSTSQSCLIKSENNTITVSSSKTLNAEEGVTVGVSFPKNIVSVIEPRQDNPSIFLIILLVITGLISLLWYVFFPLKILINSIKEKNFTKKNERIVTAWFQPPQYDNGTVFTPAETGFIVDKAIDHKELTSTIIHLAQRGYLKIKESEKKGFTFIKIKDWNSSDVTNFEKEVIEAIFEKGDEVKDKDLKNSTTLFGKIAKFNKYVENEVVEKGMFEKKPTEVFAKYMVLFGLGLTTMNIFLALVSIIFGGKLAKRTLKGIEKYSEAKSLLNFLESQDEQLNFQSKNQMFFEKLLPYAAAFGVEKVWAERFKDISMVKPDWYDGNNYTNSAFIGSMTHSIGGSMKSAYSSSMSSTRSSSGFSSGFSGGSSGGGGGGGGVGSW